MRLVGDLHIHSIVSDGSLHPSDIVRISKVKSLHVFSITDHNTFLGSLIASKYVNKKDQVLLYGAEVRTCLGDILILCPQPVTITCHLYRMVDLCRDNNCILIPAHPYDILRSGIGGNMLMKLWDAIEVFNGSSDLISNIITYILAKDSGIPLVSNSDAHVGELIGTFYNVIYANGFNADAVLESIRKGKVLPVIKYSIRGSISRISWGLKNYLNNRVVSKCLDEGV